MFRDYEWEKEMEKYFDYLVSIEELAMEYGVGEYDYGIIEEY